MRVPSHMIGRGVVCMYTTDDRRCLLLRNADTIHALLLRISFIDSIQFYAKKTWRVSRRAIAIAGQC